MPTESFLVAVALGTSALAAVSDARTGRIPNVLTLPVLCGALAVQVLAHGARGLMATALALSVTAVPNVFLFVRGALGGGDVKLFAALGALLGVGPTLELEWLAFVLVALWAVLRVSWQGQLLLMARQSGQATLHLMAPARFSRPEPVASLGTEVRMGPAILLATVVVIARQGGLG